MDDNRLPWFHCYPEKLLGALSALDPDAGYIYTIILLRIYEVRGAIKDDAGALARRSGIPQKRVTAALKLLREKRLIEPTDDGGLHNAFAKIEIVAGAQTARHNSKAAKTRADRRWEKHKQTQRNGHAGNDAAAMLPDADLDSDLDKEREDSATPLKTSSPKVTIDKPPPVAVATNGFNRSGPARDHCYWTESGYNSPDGKVTITNEEIEAYAKAYPALKNIEGQIGAALHVYANDRPERRKRMIARFLADREQDHFRKTDVAESKRKPEPEAVYKRRRP